NCSKEFWGTPTPLPKQPKMVRRQLEGCMSPNVELVPVVGGYRLHWHEQGVSVLFEHLDSQRHGLTGEITIAPDEVTFIESARVNLNTEAKTNSIAKKVPENSERISPGEWAKLIESSCVLALREYRRGEPLVVLNKDTQVEPLTFTINPV